MRYLSIIFCISLLSCSQHKNSLKNEVAQTDTCEGFWYKRTFYNNRKVHTCLLLTKDTVPIKIISYRLNGSIEAEFLFGSNRDSLGYGLVIHYDSSKSNQIENVEIVGINRSSLWKGFTLFYRKADLMKKDMKKYKSWEEKIDVKGKNYYFDW